MIFLSAEECRALLDAGAVLDAVDEALRMEDAGTVSWSTPPDLRVAGGERGGRLRVKACALTEPAVAGVRVLEFPSDGSATRWVLLFDGATGEPLAIVDEAWTYVHRSIASLAVVAHRLRPREVRTVAIVGAGRIAGAALAYVDRLFPGAAVAIASRREETRSALAGVARDAHGMRASAVPAESAVRGAQIVLACTSASSPVLLDAWVAPGTVVGSLETVESDPAFFESADLRVVDSREQLAPELADAFGPDAPGKVDATMAEVMAGAHPGRTSDAQRILVVSQGLVSQDVLLALRAYHAAKDLGVGTPLAIPHTTR
jgi:ornithine cyclodeaminase/alanine dehydrogenase-like protein (mu-crystallin family)